MSTSSSSAAAAAASGAAAMADAPAGEAAPKLKIGSHLSRNYKEDKNPSGFLCGRTLHIVWLPCVDCSGPHLGMRWWSRLPLPQSPLPLASPFSARADCSSVNQLSFGDTTVRCRDCGNRILYKVRQRRRK